MARHAGFRQASGTHPERLQRPPPAQRPRGRHLRAALPRCQAPLQAAEDRRGQGGRRRHRPPLLVPLALRRRRADQPRQARRRLAARALHAGHRRLGGSRRDHPPLPAALAPPPAGGRGGAGGGDRRRAHARRGEQQRALRRAGARHQRRGDPLPGRGARALTAACLEPRRGAVVDAQLLEARRALPRPALAARHLAPGLCGGTRVGRRAGDGFTTAEHLSQPTDGREWLDGHTTTGQGQLRTPVTGGAVWALAGDIASCLE
mmetsp:Transcript_49780/g.88002  ORF Transcript_49780/g.88002 Transcript_49780/m.88002 type:complete len:262 (-) Transcript_49780:255-1040(-)